MIEAMELSAESQAKLEEMNSSILEFFTLIDRMTADTDVLKQQVASLEMRLSAAEAKLASQ